MNNAPTAQVGAEFGKPDNQHQSTDHTPQNNHISADTQLREHQATQGLNGLVMETTLLRGMLSYPARKVITVTDNMAEEDLYDAHHRVIYRVVAKQAKSLLAAGEGDVCVDPVVVQLELQNTGKLSHGVTASVLIEAVTGNPPALVDLHTLATGCKVRRLRRECTVVGRSLIATGAEGSINELIKAITDAHRLGGLAERAGLETIHHGF